MPPASVFDCDVLLKDGSTLALRKAEPADAPAVLEFLTGLSNQSQYQRFLGVRKLDLRSARALTVEDARFGVALVGECRGRLVALAGFYKEQPESQRAEVAFAIADDLQGRGVGTRLLERLAGIARTQGVWMFEAYVLAGNARMLDVFADSGFGAVQTLERGVVHVTLSLACTPFPQRIPRRWSTSSAVPGCCAGIGALRRWTKRHCTT